MHVVDVTLTTIFLVPMGVSTTNEDRIDYMWRCFLRPVVLVEPLDDPRNAAGTGRTAVDAVVVANHHDGITVIRRDRHQPRVYRESGRVEPPPRAGCVARQRERPPEFDNARRATPPRLHRVCSMTRRMRSHRYQRRTSVSINA